MDLQAFFDKSKTPSDADLAAALGAAMPHWNELKKLVSEIYSPIEEDWAFSGKSLGWALRLKQKKRPVLYLKPLEGSFRASFALREDAVQAVAQSDLPERVRNLVANAPKYPEGYAIRMEVEDGSEIPTIAKLLAFRMAS